MEWISKCWDVPSSSLIIDWHNNGLIAGINAISIVLIDLIDIIKYNNDKK